MSITFQERAKFNSPDDNLTSGVLQVRVRGEMS